MKKKKTLTKARDEDVKFHVCSQHKVKILTFEKPETEK